MSFPKSLDLDDLREVDKDSVSMTDLFETVTALIMRVERLEVTLGSVINVVLLAMTDAPSPGEEAVEKTINALADYNRQIAEEVKLRHELAATETFLEQPE